MEILGDKCKVARVIYPLMLNEEVELTPPPRLCLHYTHCQVLTCERRAPPCAGLDTISSHLQRVRAISLINIFCSSILSHLIHTFHCKIWRTHYSTTVVLFKKICTALFGAHFWFAALPQLYLSSWKNFIPFFRGNLLETYFIILMNVNGAGFLVFLVKYE